MSKPRTPEQLERKRAYCRKYSKQYYRLHPRTEEQKKRNRDSVLKYWEKNKEKVRQRNHDYYMAHRDQAYKFQREWIEKNREHIRIKARDNYKKHIEARRAGRKALARKEKEDVIREYGGECFCCGETRHEFLTMDHVGGRKKHGHARTFGGPTLYRWLRMHGYPKEGFRLACLNCNFSHGQYGYCPHERERQAQAAD